jgi:2-dehydro-3-deoxygluconokinase
MTTVVTLGECLISFVADDAGPLAEAAAFHRFVAGAEANVAVGLVRLGTDVAFIGRVGGDGFGTAIVRHLRGEGVDTTHLRVDPGAPTGLMFRERRILGPAQVVYARSGSAGSRLTARDVDAATESGVFEDARWLHVTGITPALSVEARAATERAIAIARGRGLVVSLDLNLRRRLWSDEYAAPVLRAMAVSADVVLGSPDELAVLVGATERGGGPSSPADLARVALDLGPSIVVAKLGAGGSLAVSRDAPDRPILAPGVVIPIVLDPIGAGDAFSAGFIAARLEGVELPRALATANACGAAAAATLGDQTGAPDRHELAALIDAQPDANDTIR